MNAYTDQRQKCQELLAQLKQSQEMLKSHIGSSDVTSTNFSSSMTPSGYNFGTTNYPTSQLHPGILKTSSVGPRPFSNLDTNNSACVNFKRGLQSKTLPQGLSCESDLFDIYPPSNTATNWSDAPVYSNANNFESSSLKAGISSLKHSSVENNESETRSKHSIATQNSSTFSASPTKQNWREILDKHVTVPTQLTSQEIQDLENQHSLNYSYVEADKIPSAGSDASSIKDSFKRRPLQSSQSARVIKPTAVCEDITNKPISVSLSDMPKTNMPSRDVHKEELDIKHNEKSQSKKVKFFKDQLEDEGNSRKLNSFIKDTTIKSKSLLNSSAYRSLCPKQDADELTAEDQRLLGYDWIAALLDNDSSLVNQSESFFNELKDFRRAYKGECSNQFYRETPHTLVEFEAEPVAEALRETKVHPYIVNERLFTQPFKSGLIEYQDEDNNHDKKYDHKSKKAPSEDNPRFVRVSIPRSTLSTPYKVKPHRRRSFDGSDSCSLIDHCLLGWENSRPAMIPTAKSLDLNTEAGTRIDSQVTTLNEAERLAAKFSQADWPFSRPTARINTLPKWRKHYMDTTLNLSMLSGLGSNSNNSATSNNTTNASLTSTSHRAGVRDVKRSTDKILSATYSAMYEMERVRKERDLEMAAAKNS